MTGVAVFHVDDPGDPRIADYRNVPDPALLEQRHVFIAEGRLVVRRLLASRRLVARSVMVTEAAQRSLDELLDPEGAIPVFVVPQAVMNGVTGYNMHRGCLAIGERPPLPEWRHLAAGAAHLVVLERVANADNVGSVFRNAAAFGAGAVLLGPACADPLYRKAIRTSMGAALSLPYAHATPWPGALRALRADGIRVVGLTPSRDAGPLRDVLGDGRGARVALVAGHEGDGLTSEAMEACDALARIPMACGVDSLNVATAVAVALYESSTTRTPFTAHDSGAPTR